MKNYAVKYLLPVLLLTCAGRFSFGQQQAADSLHHLDTIPRQRTRTLHVVTVSAGSFEASDKAKGASLTPIDAVTVAGSNGDITQALRSLPGAQQIGDKEGLFVRGGTGEETKQFIDGTLLRNPNYPSVPGIQQYARINPFLFKGILFSSGGYSALYGQAMSSALIMESVDLPEKSSASFSLFPANTGIGFQQLTKNNRSSYGVDLHYSSQRIYNSVVPQKPDFFAGPEYIDGDANFRIKTGKTGMLKFYTTWDVSDVGMYNPDIDSAALRSGYRVKGKSSYSNLSYRNALNDDWKMDIGLTYSYNRITTNNNLVDAKGAEVSLPEAPFKDKFRYSRITSNFAQARMVFTRNFSQGQAIRFGAEHFYSEDKGTANDSALALTDNLTAAFAEGDIYLADNLAAKTGVRMEYSSLLRKWVIAPRISLAYRLPDGGQFNVAYGIFYQEPQNDFLYHNRDLNFSSATHYVLNYTKKISNRLFRVEAYYKHYNDLVKTSPGISTAGTGYAKGLEFFFRDKRSIKNLDYWITYTYLDTKRDFMNYPYALSPSFAAPHTGTIAIKKFIQSISTSVNVSYAVAAGRPYYDIRYNPAINSWQLYDQGTTKAYSVMNLHVAYLTSFFKHWKRKDFSGFAFGVNNLLGTRQVFGYNYSYDGRNKMPVTLPATRNYFIGVFMSFGIDRTDDFLNDNL
ncbi:TonB-dependent receptor plug domain-containing protein [Chitinophaga sp. MM2321]|uniref:TonB-dependent receptor plug domain-containing protein n=1 Tax=Chitinophaga sp. MM2321 TaxID=3137178 RepID=UPI0032D57DFF